MGLMLTNSAKRTRRRAFGLRTLRRFARDRKGAAAVEFAIISIPYFAIIFFMLENGYNYFVQSQLDHATSSAARAIKLGQAAKINAGQFKSMICSGLLVAPGCEERLSLEVRSLNSESFQDDPFCPGGPGQNVLVHVAYVTPVISSVWLASWMRVNGEPVRVLRTGLVFRTEPYLGDSGAVC